MLPKKRLITNEDALELADPIMSKELGDLVKSFAGKFATNIVGELSAAKLFIIAGKVTREVRDDFRAKKLVAFWKSLEENTKSVGEYEALNNKDKEYIRDLIITQ